MPRAAAGSLLRLLSARCVLRGLRGGGGVVKRVTRVFTREIKSEILTVHVMEARQRPMHALLLLMSLVLWS